MARLKMPDMKNAGVENAREENAAQYRRDGNCET